MALFEAFMLLVEVISGVRLIVSEVAELRKQFKKMIKDIENTGKHDQVQELDKKLTSIASQVSAAHSGKRLDSQYITQQFRNSLDELEKSSELQSVRNVKKTLDMLESQGNCLTSWIKLILFLNLNCIMQKFENSRSTSRFFESIYLN